MDFSPKRKILLILLLASAALLSLYGGFRVNHIDTEYYKSLYNKSYFLHNIYHLASKVELKIKRTILQDNQFLQTTSIKKFKHRNQRHGISLYFVNGFFVLLGIFFCFKLAFLLTSNFWLSYLAAWILTSCYFWNAEAHYPTTDVPLSSLIITSLFFIVTKASSGRKSQILEGILLGSCFAVKYAGLIFLAPYLFYKFKRQELKQSILPVITALFFLAINIADKFKNLLKNVNRELHVQTQEGWAGYNSDETAFLFHIKESLITEYGLYLSLLALIGIYYCYKNLEDKNRLIFYTTLIFMLAHITLISSTIIKTVRFALPLVPFLAIFSAFGLYQTYILTKTYNPNLAKIIITLLLILATGPALKNSVRHDYLMARPDTADFVFKLRKEMKNIGAVNILLDDRQLFDKTPNLDDIQYLRRCTSSPKDFKKIFKFNEYPNLVVSTNSFKLDRFIFDKAYHCDNEHKAFKNFEDLRLLQITPFKVAKEEVPFSFISNFSPRKPDLKYRDFKGGFFELYYTKPEYETLFKKLCKENNYPCAFTNGAQSYFLNELQTSFTDPKIRKKSTKKDEN